jgi:hypothetical protein
MTTIEQKSFWEWSPDELTASDRPIDLQKWLEQQRPSRVPRGSAAAEASAGRRDVAAA